jgi:signal transduction histidine kinase
MRRLLACALVAFGSVVTARAAADSGPPKSVLIVFSHERERTIYDPLDSNLRSAITAAAHVNLYTEYLDAMRFDEENSRAPAIAYLRAKYAQRPLDAIVAVSPLALDFVLEHRDELFPNVPIVFASVNRSRIGEIAHRPNVTGVAVQRELTTTLDLALMVHPGTRTVFIPAGRGAQEQAWTDETRSSLEPYRNRVRIEFLTDLTMNELEARLAHLPDHSLVLSAGLLYYDANDQYFLPEEVLRRICRSANVPVYSTGEPELGLGIVGGSLYDMAPVGTAAGVMVRRVLAGEQVSQIPIETLDPNYAMFDARQLERWSIDERRLPSGAIVRFRRQTLWRDYRGTVLGGAAALLLQSVLILGLLYQRHARRKANMESRRNLALAADANRRATVSAMTSSIAHDLRQPLGAILHNTAAAERLLGSGRATPAELGEILADIRMDNVRAREIIDRHSAMLKRRDVERTPIDLQDVVRESLALVVHDMRTRQIDLHVELPPGACWVIGDRVLLQQVLVNLLVNARDAMADTPPDRRRITIQVKQAETTFEMSVRDAGTGLVSAIDGRQFEPFVTTKPDGLGIGLTISRSIVEAHQGRLEARNNVDGGATFCVTLPCAAVAST